MAPLNPDLVTVLNWLAAVTARDKEGLIALSDADIAINGTRGKALGVDVLGQWLEATHLKVMPREAYLDAQRIMVVHDMEWLDAEGNIAGSLRNASLFEVQNGLVTAYERDDEPDALPRHGFGTTEPSPVTED